MNNDKTVGVKGFFWLGTIIFLFIAVCFAYLEAVPNELNWGFIWFIFVLVYILFGIACLLWD